MQCYSFQYINFQLHFFHRELLINGTQHFHEKDINMLKSLNAKTSGIQITDHERFNAGLYTHVE